MPRQDSIVLSTVPVLPLLLPLPVVHLVVCTRGTESKEKMRIRAGIRPEKASTREVVVYLRWIDVEEERGVMRWKFAKSI